MNKYLHTVASVGFLFTLIYIIFDVGVVFWEQLNLISYFVRCFGPFFFVCFAAGYSFCLAHLILVIFVVQILSVRMF